MISRGSAVSDVLFGKGISDVRIVGIIGFLLALLSLTLFYSFFSSVEMVQTYLYYVPLVIVAVWYSNRSIWTAAALSLGYVVVTLVLAVGGYSVDPVLLFLFTLLYL